MSFGNIIINCCCTVPAEAVSLVLDGKNISLERKGHVWIKDLVVSSGEKSIFFEVDEYRSRECLLHSLSSKDVVYTMYITESLNQVYKLIYKDESANSQTEKWVVEELTINEDPNRGSLATGKTKLKLVIPKNIGRIHPTYRYGEQ